MYIPKIPTSQLQYINAVNPIGTGIVTQNRVFFRVYADLCTVKTINFWHNEAIVQQGRLAKSFDRTIEILTGKTSKDLCTVKPTQHKIVTHYKRFEVRQVFRPYLHSVGQQHLII